MFCSLSFVSVQTQTYIKEVWFTYIAQTCGVTRQCKSLDFCLYIYTQSTNKMLIVHFLLSSRSRVGPRLHLKNGFWNLPLRGNVQRSSRELSGMTAYGTNSSFTKCRYPQQTRWEGFCIYWRRVVLLLGMVLESFQLSSAGVPGGPCEGDGDGGCSHFSKCAHFSPGMPRVPGMKARV